MLHSRPAGDVFDPCHVGDSSLVCDGLQFSVLYLNLCLFLYRHLPRVLPSAEPLSSVVANIMRLGPLSFAQIAREVCTCIFARLSCEGEARVFRCLHDQRMKM